jgi:hypothetical protein
MPTPSATPVTDKSKLAMMPVGGARGVRGMRAPVGVIHKRGNLDAAEGIKGNLRGREWVQWNCVTPVPAGQSHRSPRATAKVLPMLASSTNPEPDAKNSK